MRRSELITAVLMALGLTGSVSGDPPVNQDEVQKQREDTNTKAEASALLQQPDSSEFQKRLSELDSKSAMLAKRFARVPLDSPAKLKGELLRFVGYLEGTCALSAPDWWAGRFENCELSNGFLRFNESRSKEWCQKLREDLYAAGRGEFSIAENGDIFLKRESGEALVVPFGVRSKAYHDHRFLAVADNESDVFACYFGRLGFTYELVAIKKSDRTIRWRKSVWATGLYSWSGPLPPFDHRVELIVAGPQVGVFGACVEGAYFESFRCRDGFALLRFGTSAP